MNPAEESPGDRLKALSARGRAAALPWLAALRDRYLALDRKLQIGTGAGVLVVALALSGGGSGGDSNSLTFAARRGNLDITVLEGGALEALQSQEIRSRVRDRSGVKILSIVEEGYRVTEEDVAAGMILVEPEAAPSGLPEGIEIESLPPPMQNRIRQMMAENGGQLPPEMVERMQRFAAGEFPPGGRPGGGFRGGGGFGDGATVEDPAPALEIGDRIEEVAVLELPPSDIDPVPPEVTLLMDESYMEIRDRIDFTQYADFEELADGEAKQRLRILLDELQVSQEEYLLAQDRIEGQRRLEARGFITPTELEAEELNLNKAANKQQEKETALRLYIQYTFPKEAEEFLSNYENAVMAYQRQVKENIAREAQELANFSSAERKFNLEKYKLADIEAQIDAATIEAELPGLVVYGGSDQGSSRYRSSSQEAIQEGATVRERQPILTIPDMREMAVSVDIHESAVQRVAVGQPAVILIDAYPDVRLTGEVIKVAVVADSANSFMNPDLKVYPSQVRIDGTHDWLRPGMSAQVEILVASLEDVVYVPVQAVSYFGSGQVVYVSRGSSVERRVIEVGDFSDSYIEVVSGLEEGEDVLLLPPRETEA